MKIKKNILTLLFFTLSAFCFCQTKSFQDYYPSGQLKTKGYLLQDTIKVGKWYYFKPNGQLLAKGKFINGYKKGKWKYIDYKEKIHFIKFKVKYREELTLDENGNLVIKDIYFDGGCYVVYQNGRFYMSALF